MRGASTLTVRAAAAGPKYAVCPAAFATPPVVQFPAVPQLPDVAAFHSDHVGGAAMRDVVVARPLRQRQVVRAAGLPAQEIVAVEAGER